MRRLVRIGSFAVLGKGDAPDVSFVPPLVRRRLSPLQRIFFALAHQVEDGASASTVFASRDGEDTLTRRIVDDFHEDGSVSPNRFSSSVYNAAPGLWSVFTKNRAPYTAVAGGEDSVECGLLELMAGSLPAMFVYAEETEDGYGVALRLVGEDLPGRDIEVLDGDPSRQPVAFDDVVRFLAGDAEVLCGRYLSLRSV
jgi:hypothetical protein